MFDLAELVTDPELGGTTFEYGRIVETVNDKGRAEFIETRLPGVGNIQPAPGKERELLPEADRGKAAVLVFTAVPLRAGGPDNQKADRIYYQGIAYRVSLAEPWREHGGFTKAIAVQEAEGA